MDIVDIVLISVLVVLVSSAVVLALYPYDIAYFMCSKLFLEPAYPKTISQDNFNYYEDSNSSVHLVLSGVPITKLHLTCTGSMIPTLGCNTTVFATPVGTPRG